MIFRFTLTVLIFSLTACAVKTVPATQVMVQIEAQSGILSQIHDVQISVRSGHGDSKWEDRFDKKMTPDSGRYKWPLQFSLVPQNHDVTRVYEVTATAVDSSGMEIAKIRAISGYRPDETLLLTLLFEDSCLGKTCDDIQTCHAGDCIDSHVNVDDLSSFNKNDPNTVSQSDSGENVPDSGADSSSNSEVDSGVDSGDSEPKDSGTDSGKMPTTDSGTDSGTVVPCSKTLCGTSCVDLNTDSDNCGACDYPAVHGRTCVSGVPTPAWQPISAVGAHARSEHTAVFSGGTLVSIGGLDSTGIPTATVDRYSPKFDEWYSVASLKTARYAHKSVVDGDNVFVFGGSTNSNTGALIGTLERCNISSDYCTIVAASGTEPSARFNFAMTLIPSSHTVMVFGGENASGTRFASGALFDEATNSWSDASCSLPGCSSIVSPYTNAFMNGSDVSLWANGAAMKYTVSTGAFATDSLPANTINYVPQQFGNDGRRIFFLQATGSCPNTATVLVYDRQTSSWSTDTAAAPTGLSSGAAVAWSGSELIAWSGSCGGAPLSIGGRYQPPTP